MHVVVGYTDMPMWVCPGDWDQILHLSKATLHQRHSNEVVFYCKLSSRGVWVWVYIIYSAWEGWENDKGERKKHQEVERCVGLSSLSVSKRIYRKWTQFARVHISLESNGRQATSGDARLREDVQTFDGGSSGRNIQRKGLVTFIAHHITLIMHFHAVTRAIRHLHGCNASSLM